jgi:predicted PurR-regulated permease PerM
MNAEQPTVKPVHWEQAPQGTSIQAIAPSDEPLIGESSSASVPVDSPAVPGPLSMHMPVSVRNLSLVVLAIFGGLFVLQWAKAVFIPLMLGLIFSYALSPLVNWAETRHMPRWLSAAVLLIAIFGGIGSAAYSLSDTALKLVDSLPTAAQKFRQAMESRRKSDSALETVQKAAAQIEQAAQTSAPANTRGAMRVVIESAKFNVRDYLWTGTIGLAALVGQTTVVIFLTYFLMCSGDTFRRKLVKLAGPSLSSKKITLQALDEITG